MKVLTNEHATEQIAYRERIQKLKKDMEDQNGRHLKKTSIIYSKHRHDFAKMQAKLGDEMQELKMKMSELEVYYTGQIDDHKNRMGLLETEKDELQRQYAMKQEELRKQLDEIMKAKEQYINLEHRMDAMRYHFEENEKRQKIEITAMKQKNQLYVRNTKQKVKEMFNEQVDKFKIEMEETFSSWIKE
jgi:hypothetical protein